MVKVGLRLPFGQVADQVESAVCVNCRSKLPELYQKQVSSFFSPKRQTDAQVVQTSSLQIDFARLWTQCQRCQGSLHQDVICTSADCPIFYRRTARQKEVTASVAQLDRFEKEVTW